MIRPASCVCMMLAAGSGLYLYQAKHQSQLLDREIERVERLTGETRGRSGVLRAEYQWLNEPSRLQDLVAAHLPRLTTLQPGQYSTMAELDSRLPPIGAPAPPAMPLETDGSAAVPPVTVPSAMPAIVAAPRHTVTAAAATKRRAAKPAGSTVAPGIEARRDGPRDPYLMAVSAPDLLATPIPRPGPAAQVGSALGMARATAPLVSPGSPAR